MEKGAGRMEQGAREGEGKREEEQEDEKEEEEEEEDTRRVWAHMLPMVSLRLPTAKLEQYLERNLQQNLMRYPPRRVFYRTSWRATTRERNYQNIPLFVFRAVR